MKFTAILGLSAAMSTIFTPVVEAAVVANGGFETGDFTGWIFSGDTSSTGVDEALPYNGSYAAYLGAEEALGFLSQILTTTPGQKYQLSYFLTQPIDLDESTNSPDLTVNHFQAFVNENKLFDQTNIAYQAYTKYTFNFIATASSTELKFGFYNQPSYFNLDDVTVNAVPEPMTIGGTLLAGGIGWLMRRRQAALQQK